MKANPHDGVPCNSPEPCMACEEQLEAASFEAGKIAGLLIASELVQTYLDLWLKGSPDATWQSLARKLRVMIAELL